MEYCRLMLMSWTEYLTHFSSFQPLVQPLETDVVEFLENTTFNFPSHSAPLMYDAVMSLSLAACKTETEFFNGTELFDKFLASEFVGASGPMPIDAETGTRRFNPSAYLVRGTRIMGPNQNGEYEVEIYDAAGYGGELLEDGSDQNKWLTPDGVYFNYSDFTLDPSPPLPPLEPVYDPIPAAARAIALSMAFLVSASAILFAIWTIRHRDHYVVRASQPGFLLVVGLGCFFMSASADPNVRKICRVELHVWLLALLHWF